MTRTSRSPYISSSDNCIIAKIFHNGIPLRFPRALTSPLQYGVSLKIHTLPRCDVHYLSAGICFGKGKLNVHLSVDYYAALLPRRGPHIASHSLCPSVCLSVRPVIVTERHVAPPSELQ